MPNKPPKFLLSKSIDGDLFITHTRKPFILFGFNKEGNKFEPLEYSVKEFSLEDMERLKELRKIVNEWYFYNHVKNK
jgi:hypothetical protein